MIAISQVRKLALGLPEAVEQDHHGMPSFRVRGKIFATVPDRDHVRIMVEEDDIRAAVDEDPLACEEVWWGGRLSCVAADLRAVAADLVRGLIVDAWRRKAPRSLVDELEASSSAP